MKVIFLISVCLFSLQTTAQNYTGTILGKLVDSKTGEPVLFANLFLMKGDSTIAATSTGLDGKFEFFNVMAGKNLILKTGYVGYSPYEFHGLEVYGNRITQVNIKLNFEGKLHAWECVSLTIPIVRIDNNTLGEIFPGEELRRLPL